MWGGYSWIAGTVPDLKAPNALKYETLRQITKRTHETSRQNIIIYIYIPCEKDRLAGGTSMLERPPVAADAKDGACAAYDLHYTTVCHKMMLPDIGASFVAAARGRRTEM